MHPLKSNIVLIGMPGSGKSTVGVLLAKHLAKDFVDTDVVIQRRQGKTLAHLLQEGGPQRLMAAEAEVLNSLQVESHVIATGGSAVYSAAGMRNLAANGFVVFLDVPLATLIDRLGDLGERGVVREPGESLESLFNARRPLYEQYADMKLDCSGLTQQQIVELIATACE